MATLGIVFAFGALLAWTFGDFFIQKSVRVIGGLKTLFLIDFIGTLILLPFVSNEIPKTFLNLNNVFLLTATGLIIFAAATLDFEALRKGKLAIIEPILGSELPITVLLASFLWQEKLSLIQILLIVLTFLGITLAITTHHTHLHYHRRIFERGVFLAIAGSIIMGAVNFLMGASSQATSPLVAMWFTNVVTIIPTTIFLLLRKEFSFINPFKNNWGLILKTSLLDNMAWTSYAFATTLIPISIATTISEGYIAFAVLLGVFLNREKLRKHQIFGIAIAIFGILAISTLVKN